MGMVVSQLKSIGWRGLGVRLAILHGSALRSDKFRDVDLIVFADRHVEADDVALRVMEAVESVVGVEADVYVVNDYNEVDCFLLLEALRNGVIPYQEPLGRDMLVKSTGICVDFMISRRKLKYTETLVKKVLGDAPRQAHRNNS